MGTYLGQLHYTADWEKIFNGERDGGKIDTTCSWIPLMLIGGVEECERGYF